jgi:hypothetical protein
MNGGARLSLVSFAHIRGWWRAGRPRRAHADAPRQQIDRAGASFRASSKMDAGSSDCPSLPSLREPAPSDLVIARRPAPAARSSPQATRSGFGLPVAPPPAPTPTPTQLPKSKQVPLGAARCGRTAGFCPHSAASKYSRSSSSSSFANSSHRLAMSSSRRLLSSSMVLESCRQAAALFLYSCAAEIISTPLLNRRHADKTRGHNLSSTRRSSRSGLARPPISYPFTGYGQNPRTPISPQHDNGR